MYSNSALSVITSLSKSLASAEVWGGKKKKKGCLSTLTIICKTSSGKQILHLLCKDFFAHTSVMHACMEMKEKKKIRFSEKM